MTTLQKVAELQAWRDQQPATHSLGFVPTMGALHEGHLSLIRRSQAENRTTLVSIFVNPTQFNDSADFQSYPKPLDSDLEKLKALGVDAVFCPQQKDLYPDNYTFRVCENSDSLALCGQHRPGHFDGVLSIMMKLLNLTRPQSCYMGEKDFQQLRLVTQMVESFFLPTKIIPCPTLRDPDGLAMSSRNLLLSPAEREMAPAFYRALKDEPNLSVAQKKLETLGFQVDYLEERWGRRLGAVRIGQVRLIDNVQA